MRREYPVHPILGVGAVVLHKGRLLLVRRGAAPSMGKWSIPGGIVELGERVRDAVLREVKEECGLDIELETDKPIDVLDSLVKDKNERLKYHYVLLQFLARSKGENFIKPASDVIDARWVPLDEVKTYDLTESLRLFLKRQEKEMDKLSLL